MFRKRLQQVHPALRRLYVRDQVSTLEDGSKCQTVAKPVQTCGAPSTSSNIRHLWQKRLLNFPGSHYTQVAKHFNLESIYPSTPTLNRPEDLFPAQ
ncbi:unnamed protein product [Parascedosporium putredinis]|uniref:Uncharacterized protein n=1 Tax=Parascedosporium putredinis TaxID=1442378 RepID=A0A9P1M6F1_9PEZI|nr:unnamed protein product [Parascedosporium putredinis]CAI7987282.1 unnamed protein product [Parascedosporium putredinis]